MGEAQTNGAFPYAEAAPAQIWSRAVSAGLPEWPGAGLDIQPWITPETRIVSAGSCFAHAISHYLQSQGYAYLVTESGPPWLSAEQLQAFQYGRYSARYGHIYTPLQFLQLLQRAWGEFVPQNDLWPLINATSPDQPSTWADPFRPRIQPGGFVSPEALRADRQEHLAAVRSALSQADLLILTLGLTECWRSRDDGAVYPVCPGRGLGEFDPQAYVFENLSLAQVENALRDSLDFLARVNPNLRWILTLSPVPLAVTAEKRHVLEATAYSKAVLRVAIEQICKEMPQVAYFPAYEWVMYDRVGAFEADGRQVRPEMVLALMQRFEAGFVQKRPPTPPEAEKTAFAVQPCDEEALLSLLDRDFQSETRL